MKKILLLSVSLLAVSLSGCNSDADVASDNISEASENFEVDRRIVFYNSITDTYMLTVEGKCSITPKNGLLDVVCKTSPTEFKKHYLGLSDNVTFFAEQLESIGVSTYHHKVYFKPQSLLPDIELKMSILEDPDTKTYDDKVERTPKVGAAKKAPIKTIEGKAVVVL